MVLVIERKNNEQTFFGSTNISESFSNFVTRKQMEFLQKATEWLIEHEALVEQGIFRVPGNNDDMQAFKSRMNSIKWSKLTAEEADKIGAFDDFDDVHTVASLIKLFFRELKEPLLTFEYYDMFSYAASIPQDRTNVKLEFLKKVFVLLPETNYLMMKTLISFLSKVMQHKNVNKMDSANLAICFAPSLIRPKNSSNKTVLEELKISQHLISLTIEHYDYFFEDKDLVEEQPTPQETASSPHPTSPSSEPVKPETNEEQPHPTQTQQQTNPTPEPIPESKEQQEQPQASAVDEFPVVKTRTRHRTAAMYRTIGPAMRRPRHESLMAFEGPEVVRSEEPILGSSSKPITTSLDSEKHPSAMQTNLVSDENSVENSPVTDKSASDTPPEVKSVSGTAPEAKSQTIESGAPVSKQSTPIPTSNSENPAAVPTPTSSSQAPAPVQPSTPTPTSTSTQTTPPDAVSTTPKLSASAQAAAVRKSKVLQMKSRLEELERLRMQEMLELAQSRKINKLQQQQQQQEPQQSHQENPSPQTPPSSASVEGTSTNPSSSKSGKAKKTAFADEDNLETCDSNPLQQDDNDDNDQLSRKGVTFQEPPPSSSVADGGASDDFIPFLPKRPMPRRRATVMIGMEEKKRLVSLWEGRILDTDEPETGKGQRK